jgi:CBS domain-containing protein
MGEHDVTGGDAEAQRAFQRALLEDLAELERRVAEGCFERGIVRIGAEQEMFLVDEALSPAPVALELLEHASESRLTTEIGRYNLEANLTPRRFEGRCLRELEEELVEVVGIAREAARREGAEVVLTGMLPTLRESDVDPKWMSPDARYATLSAAVRRLRGEDFHVHIQGLDELDMRADTVMLEAFTTSFQLHYQVTPEAFAATYNVAQLVCAPVLAASVNSPVLLGRRLWKETRIALFQQSVDARGDALRVRAHPGRVTFGERWVTGPTELFREDIERHRALLGAPLVRTDEERARLSALTRHNGTIYRWNRPCLGTTDGVPHMRIEARALPAGPSIVDEVATAALLYGLYRGGLDAWGDPSARLPFEAAKDNFLTAARRGLDAQLRWLDGRSVGARALLRDELLPIARRGLKAARIDPDDIDRYLGIVEMRLDAATTGADWLLASLARMDASTPNAQRMRGLVEQMVALQIDGRPVHAWPLVSSPSRGPESHQRVGQFMTTDLYTVHAGDILDLAGALMRWERVRQVPVEDESGALVGMLSQSGLLRALAESGTGERTVGQVMDRVTVTVTPDTTTLDAMRLARDHEVTALPVIEGGNLVGLVTERDLLRAAEVLLSPRADDDEPARSREAG